jgi:septal ring factor EnvC (AmiA/AmiB activator)
MYIGRASPHAKTQSFPNLPFRRRCTRRCSALFEKLRKHINRLEHENDLLGRQLNEAQKKSSKDEKKIAELEKENSKLKRDLEATTPQINRPDSLSTPSAMQRAYNTKPSASKRRRKPAVKKDIRIPAAQLR